MKRYLGIFISAIGCLLVGSVGGVFSAMAIPVWYELLNKPRFAPPNWVFGPVWTVLYLLMGVALYLVWEKGMKKRASKEALFLFLLQLLLNLSWSWLFFGLRSPELAFVCIAILLGMIVLVIKSFYSISKLAALLLSPYLAWVSFAAVLNLYIVILN